MAEVDRLELLIEGQSKEAVKALDNMVLSMNKVNAALTTTTSSIKTGTVNIAEMNVNLKQTAAAQNSVAKSTNSLISRLSKLALAFFGLRRVMRFGWKAITSSMDFSETVNLFQTVFKKLGLDAGEEFQFAFLDKATKFNKTITEALHLDPNLIMNYQARFAQMADSMNVVEESAYNISSALTMLSADIASLFNIEIDSAMKKLQSGLAGQIRPLRELGVDISKTSLMQTAWNYGITDSIEKMSAASKVQLRFLTIIQQLRVAMGDMARTIESPANQMRILRQQWDLFTRSLGNTFLPLITKVLPYLNAMVIVLRRLIQSIAELFGWEPPDWTGVEIYRGVSDTFGDIEDGADDATDSVKKLRNAIFGFDELNVFMRPAAKDGSETPIDSGYGILDDAIAQEYAAYMQKFNEEIAKMGETAEDIANRIEKPFRNILRLVGLIGLGIASWKIASGLTSLFTGGGGFGFIGNIGKMFTPSGSTIKLLSLFGDKSAYVATATVIAGVAATIAAMALRFIDLWKNSENFRLGLGVIWEALKDIGAWFMGVFTKIGDALGLSSEVVRGLGLDLVAIALLFTPAAPFAAAYLIFDGIMWAIKGVGYASRDAIEEVDLFSDGISDLTKEKVKPFTDAMREIDDAITNISWTGMVIDDAIVEDIQTKLSEISSMIINELDADKNQALQTLAPLKYALGEEAYAELVKNNTSYYKQMQKQVQDNEAKINAIIAKAREENRALTEEEAAEIARIQAETMDFGVKHLSETEIEYQTIMNRLADNTAAISLQQASEIIKNAQLTRDEAIAAAETQFATVQLEAQRMLDVGAITQEQYDAIIEAAGKAKEDSIADAEAQYKGVFDAARENLGPLGKYIDGITGDIKTKWRVFWEDYATWFQINVFPKLTKKYWTDKFWSLIDGASAVLDELKRKFENWKAHLKVPHIEWTPGGFEATGLIKKALEALNLPTSLPSLSVKWYAGGGLPDFGELFVAREAGPELVGRIGSQSAVVNNDQIVDAVSQGVAQAVSGVVGQGGGDITLQINLGTKKLYETVITEAQRQNARAGKAIIPVGV